MRAGSPQPRKPDQPTARQACQVFFLPLPLWHTVVMQRSPRFLPFMDCGLSRLAAPLKAS